jgi:hypothetical protein
MSLDYDLTNIKNRKVNFPPNEESVHILGTLNIKLHSMIFGAMATGIGELKNEADADEYFVRYMMWSHLFSNGEVAFTRQDVHNAIGLKTNVFPRESNSGWSKRMLERYRQDTLRFHTLDEPAPN